MPPRVSCERIPIDELASPKIKLGAVPDEASHFVIGRARSELIQEDIGLMAT